ERRLLAVGQLQQSAEQQRSHLAERGAQWMPALTMHVPQRHRVGLRLMIQPWHAGDTLGNLALRCTGGAQSGQITLDVSGEYRDAGIAETLHQTLQRNGLARAGSTG